MKIYVDDLNGLFQSLPPGTEFKNGILVYNVDKAESDKDIPIDKITMDIVQDVANIIEAMIQMTSDVPCNYLDNKVPMLDVKVWKTNMTITKFIIHSMKNPQKARL